jgi:hypothetical protein
MLMVYLFSSADFRNVGALWWKEGDFENVVPILLLLGILWTLLSREKAVAARPEARMRTFSSFTITESKI